MFEMVRVLRVALILAYVRYNVRREDWWWAAAGLACGILLQAALGVLFVTTGRRIGVTAVLGLSPGADRLQALTAGVDANFGFRRAEGTFGHPNTMAVYFLLLFPLFAALGATVRDWRLRLACLGVALAGLAGVAATMSRTSWVLSVIQLALIGAGLVSLRLVSARRAIGVALLATCMGTLALVPVADRIQRRFLGNFQESVDFRLEQGRAALDIWASSPLVGVGLNNYSNVLGRYGFEEVAVFLELGEEVRNTLGIRTTAWVHNIYLLMLGETGLIGLAAFLVFIGGAFVRACRGVAVGDRAWRAAALGIAIGMIGLHAHGLQESALWIDPITCTFALLAGLANSIPALAGDGAVRSAAAARPRAVDTQAAWGRP
jgi:O-antigen ligase